MVLKAARPVDPANIELANLTTQMETPHCLHFSNDFSMHVSSRKTQIQCEHVPKTTFLGRYPHSCFKTAVKTPYKTVTV